MLEAPIEVKPGVSEWEVLVGSGDRRVAPTQNGGFGIAHESCINLTLKCV